MREYTNFEEIERDLQLLKLQKEIDKEKVILSYNFTKESLSPKRVIKSAAGKIFESPVILNSTTKVLDFIARKWS